MGAWSKLHLLVFFVHWMLEMWEMNEHARALYSTGGDQHKFPSVGTISTEHKGLISAKSKGTTGLKCPEHLWTILDVFHKRVSKQHLVDDDLPRTCTSARNKAFSHFLCFPNGNCHSFARSSRAVCHETFGWLPKWWLCGYCTQIVQNTSNYPQNWPVSPYSTRNELMMINPFAIPPF